MSGYFTRLRPVKQWDAPKDPLKDWEKYGFYPEIEEMTCGSKPQSAILRASLGGLPPLPLQYKTDGEGRKYMELPDGINVSVYTGINTEELRTRVSSTYLLCVYDVEEPWPWPSCRPSFYTDYSRVNVELRPRGRVYHGQKIARVTLHRYCPNSNSLTGQICGDEFVEFMAPKVSYGEGFCSDDMKSRIEKVVERNKKTLDILSKDD